MEKESGNDILGLGQEEKGGKEDGCQRKIIFYMFIYLD